MRMTVARRDQFTVYVKLDKAPDVIALFDMEAEAVAAHNELLNAIEAARAGKQSLARFADGKYSIDAKRYVSSRVATAMSTPGLTVEGISF
jgi:hypothetical protein